MTLTRAVKEKNKDSELSQTPDKPATKVPEAVQPDQTEEPKLRAVSQIELRQILEEHQEWLESGETKREPVNLRRANLQKPNVTGADLKGADLTGVEGLSEAKLHNANLDKVTGPLGSEFARADVTGAVLPKDIGEFKVLQVVEETSKDARKIFLSMLLGCTYSWLSIATTTDVRLLTNSTSSPLPIIGTEIPIAYFYWAAPFILVALYVYLHFYLQMLREGLAGLPAIFPDGKRLDQRVTGVGRTADIKRLVCLGSYEREGMTFTGSRKIRAVLFAFVLSVASFSASADMLTVMGLNVESDADTDWNTVAGLMREFDGVDVWGLSEVQNWQAAIVFHRAAKHGESDSFRYFVSRSGGTDRLQIIYNSTKLRLLETRELHYIKVGRRIRAPLIGRFEYIRTGTTFIFMVNHLYRGSRQTEGDRHRQATLLNEWARGVTDPVIAVGNYNFDWDVDNGDTDHDQGYDNLTANGVFDWVRPTPLVSTQCNPNLSSVLDFVFVANDARNWTASSEILKREPKFCEGDATGGTDQRPVRAVLEIR